MQLRIGQSVAVILVMLVINFLLPRVMPGDPTQTLTGTNLDLPYTLDETARARMLAYYGLDESLPRQFVSYLGNLCRGDLGYAYYFQCDVSRLIAERLPWTLLLAGSSLVLATLLGMVLGTVAAYWQGTWIDRWLIVGVIGWKAAPSYLLGMLAILLFSVTLGWCPLGGALSPMARYPSALAAAGDLLRHLALPALVLSLEHAARIFTLMRATMVGVRGEAFMTLAAAKGLPFRRLLFRHGMRNALLPLHHRLGIYLGSLVAGAIFVESVFNYPGMGRLAYEAVLVHDYPVLQGVFLLTTTAIVGANLLVDATAHLVDPRVKESHD